MGGIMASGGSFILFGAPLFEEDEVKEVVHSIKSGWVGTGPKVQKFEEIFRKYKNSNHSAAVNSCTAGLHLSLKVLDLKPGDEVITSPLTFCATINSIIHAGATPVLADIDPFTFNIDPTEVERRVTSKTKAILPVHFAGRACDMDSLTEFAKSHKLSIIEDCAHAIETTYKGKHAGTFGDFGCFSFYATKNISTGEGGMVIAKDEEKIIRIKRLALHGMSKDAWKRFSDSGYQHYYVEEAGFKYNMMDIQAALGIHQIAKISQFRSRREVIWNKYNDAFSDLPITLPAKVEEHSEHAYHLYTILIDKKRVGITRDQALSKLNSLGIGCGVHYLSIPDHPFYQKSLKWKPSDFPNANRVGKETISLPLSPKLSDKEVDRIISSVYEVLRCH
jgi:dTDP-4-amino-4,6-dideoxygalactose transaminase